MRNMLIAGILATATVSADTDRSTVIIRLHATVETPLEIQVLNDSELDPLDQLASPTRVFRDLNTGAVRMTTAPGASTGRML